MTIERSSGENWSLTEDEKLRKLFSALIEQMPGRSEAAVFARLERLRRFYYHFGWPSRSLFPQEGVD